MVLLVPMIAIAGGTWQEIVWSAAIAVLVVARHSSNIRRLLRADERTAT
jgi:glycerol-3-phosphate acyltransferase PlsY